MTNVALFSNNLPADSSKLAQTLSAAGAMAKTASGVPFLKLSRHSGEWAYGAEDVPLEPGELLAVDPQSFTVGVIGWSKGNKVGEEMYPITSGQTVDKSQLEHIDPGPKGEDGWRDQVCCGLKSMKDGTELVYPATSHGGKTALMELMGAIGTQMGTDPDHPIPVVEFSSESYKHGQYGKIWKPILKIVQWLDADGNAPKKQRKLV